MNRSEKQIHQSEEKTLIRHWFKSGECEQAPTFVQVQLGVPLLNEEGRDSQQLLCKTPREELETRLEFGEARQDQPVGSGGLRNVGGKDEHVLHAAEAAEHLVKAWNTELNK